MVMSHLLFLSFSIFYEYQIIITMFRSWFIKFLFCFSNVYHRKRTQQQKTTSNFVVTNAEQRNFFVSCPSMCHTFSPPLKVCMLRKIRCRIRSQIQSNYQDAIPLSVALYKHKNVDNSLNESQNCAETLRFECTSSIIHGKRIPSLIAVDIGKNESPREQKTFTFVKQLKSLRFPRVKPKLKNKICFNE